MKHCFRILVTAVVSSLPWLAHADCYLGFPRVLDCGIVGQPTRIATGFLPVTSNATGMVKWGDEQDNSYGFMAQNSTETVTLSVSEELDEHRIILEHTYKQAGTYSIYVDTTVYTNLTIGAGHYGYCLKQQVPGVLEDGIRTGEWQLTISDSRCREEYIRSSAVGFENAWKWVATMLLMAQVALWVV